MGEQLDPGFAVFNGHINDADERARALMRRWFPDWLDVIERIQKGDGIMTVFDDDPTPATAAYVALVTQFVNENAPTPSADVGS